MFKIDSFSDDGYKVAKLCNFETGITLKSLKSIGQFLHD